MHLIDLNPNKQLGDIRSQKKAINMAFFFSNIFLDQAFTLKKQKRFFT